MSLKAKDTYRVITQYGLNEQTMTSLMCLYQPLIGGDGVLLYLTLYAESKSPQTQKTHSRLISLMNIPADVIERARYRLEEYLLLRTYEKNTETRNAYIYVLREPMNAEDFCGMKSFLTAYRERVGQKQMETTIASMNTGAVNTSGYKDITRAVKHTRMPEYENEVRFTELKPRYTFADDDETINFDYEKFLATTSTLVFPAELRSQENMALIGKLASIYGLTPDKMRVLVMRCVNIEDMEFDTERLKICASKEKPEKKEVKDIYDLPPVSFLQGKQNGAQVSLTDKKILEHLSLDMHLPNVVINVMIEYILRISNNRLNPKFVDMVASEWARDGITTKEQALLETKKNVTSHSRNVRISAPDFMNGETGQAEKPTQSELDEIRKQQEIMRKRHGED